MLTDSDFRRLNSLFPDAVGDCPYCIEDMGDDIIFLVAYRDNKKKLFFQISLTTQFNKNVVETYEWKINEWIKVDNCLQ